QPAPPGRPGVDLSELLQTEEGNALLAQAVEASKKIEAAPEGVRDLLFDLAKDSPGVTKPLPNLDWLDNFIAATKDLDAASIEKLRRMKWVPADNASSADMKKKIEEALKRPDEPP